ncbi:hypothetical protein [Sphingobacterium suaedae]|uniref:Uncharacterized protein n=1 Tax=Sphingobacterium suaedae TaxID=1686402 RepID=A0ABW5KHC4_9SPHI
MSEENKDALDRKIDGIVKLARLDSVKVMLIVSVFFNIYQYVDNRDLNSAIVEEVRKQVNPAVDSKVSTALPKAVEDAVQPMKEGVQQGMEKLDTVLNKVINKQ